jgi:integrase
MASTPQDEPLFQPLDPADAVDGGATLPAASGGPALSPELVGLVDDAEEFRQRARADSTRRAYATDWGDFTVWCGRHGASPLPADPRVVAVYLSDRAKSLKTASLQRRLSAIQHYHREAGHRLDTRHATLRDVWAGIKRTLGVAGVSKAPAVTEEIRALLEVLSTTELQGIRDRALLLVGFAGCFRRSEVAGLTTADVVLEPEGLVITLASSKTDKFGAGYVKGLPYGQFEATCPVRAFLAWVAAAGITEGPVFRPVNRHGAVLPAALSDKAVALVVKRTVAAARDAAVVRGNLALAQHFDPARYAGHSLRSGFLTSGAEAGVSLKELMDQAAHLRADTTLRYIKRAGVFRQNAAAKVGL